MREHARYIYENAIRDNLPDNAVKKALGNMPNYSGRLILVAIGKASYQMAKSASECLGDRIDKGIVITKYGHSKGELPRIEICEASHPVLDENTILSTRKALKLTEGLKKEDLVLFLVSGGGSALFEDIDCELSQMQALTDALLKCGASIEEINTVRKHISRVKGGKFALHCMPARVYVWLPLSRGTGFPHRECRAGNSPLSLFPPNSPLDTLAGNPYSCVGLTLLSRVPFPLSGGCFRFRRGCTVRCWHRPVQRAAAPPV